MLGLDFREHPRLLKNSAVPACEPQISPKNVDFGVFRAVYVPNKRVYIEFFNGLGFSRKFAKKVP